MKTRNLIIIASIAILGLFVFGKKPSYNIVDIVIEETIQVENWMTKPFVDSFEEPLEIEDWMLVPFNIN